MPVIVLDRSVRSDDYPWEEAVWWVPSADAFVSFCCYIKGKAKKSMERIEGTVLCQIWFVTSDCRSRVIHQTQRHTKSFLFRRPSFSPSLGCPSSSIKKPKRCGCLCVHTALVYTYRTCTIYSLSDALGYPHIVRMWFDPSCSPVADPSWREGAKRDRAHTVRQHAQQENEAY